jgi:hypothetical protein
MSLKISLSVLLTGTLLAAATGCSQEAEKKDTAVTATIDSLVSIRISEANMQAMDQLDSRISIEVPQKADSIANARLVPTPVK